MEKIIKLTDFSKGNSGKVLSYGDTYDDTDCFYGTIALTSYQITALKHGYVIRLQITEDYVLLLGQQTVQTDFSYEGE